MLVTALARPFNLPPGALSRKGLPRAQPPGRRPRDAGPKKNGRDVAAPPVILPAQAAFLRACFGAAALAAA
jgi:hypothetical protein